jgi:hypothetical protein
MNTPFHLIDRLKLSYTYMTSRVVSIYVSLCTCCVISYAHRYTYRLYQRLEIPFGRDWRLFTFSQVLINYENLKIISIIGGIAIVVFGFTQIINITKGKGDKQNAYIAISEKKGPILLGVIFSALNPFFLIWWFTVGLKLITDSIHFFGLVNGILFLFSFHIRMDYAWLVIASYLIEASRY